MKGRIFFGGGDVWMFIGWVNFPGGLISQGKIFRGFIFHGENFPGNLSGKRTGPKG